MRKLIIMHVENFRYKRQRRPSVTSDGVWSVLARHRRLVRARVGRSEHRGYRRAPHRQLRRAAAATVGERAHGDGQRLNRGSLRGACAFQGSLPLDGRLSLRHVSNVMVLGVGDGSLPCAG